jgi:hypothetical protein
LELLDCNSDAEFLISAHWKHAQLSCNDAAWAWRACEAVRCGWRGQLIKAILASTAVTLVTFTGYAQAEQTLSLDCTGVIVGSDIKELSHLEIDDKGVAFTQFAETKYFNNENGTIFRSNTYEITFGGPMIEGVIFKYVINRSTGKYVHTWEGPSKSIERELGECVKGKEFLPKGYQNKF